MHEFYLKMFLRCDVICRNTRRNNLLLYNVFISVYANTDLSLEMSVYSINAVCRIVKLKGTLNFIPVVK